MTPILEQIAIFAGAFLLFLVQPLMGRHILPWFGGSPSVWTTCMLFFQLLLLVGYGWAHWVAGRRALRWAHLLLVAASAPLLLITTPRAGGLGEDPTWAVLRVLTASIGPPYFLLAAASPLIQKLGSAQSPYRLYALSNAGSLMGLLTYPFLIEPTWGLAEQWRGWSLAYTGFCVLYGVTILLGRAPGRVTEPAPPVKLMWAGAAACGSVLLLATTNRLTQEVGASPFLWVLPLSIYLLTFIAAFSREAFYRPGLLAVLASTTVPAACIVNALGLRAPLAAHILVNSAVLFVCGMICHGELAQSKPGTEGLTRFYLMIAAGGAMGGAMVAIAAPVTLTSFAEFELGLAAACLILARHVSEARRQALVLAALIAAATMASGGGGETVATRRNFFGLLRVSEDHGRRALSHGRVTHGYQFLDPEKRRWPTAYYGPHSAIGLAMKNHPRRSSNTLRVGMIGLGVGTVAAYGQDGDLIRFYEINPDVDRLSSDYFTYRRDSQARVEVVLGDARMQLNGELPAGFDILAVDAFSSDSVPAHLLTVQAADVYRKHLLADGLLLFHITNQYLDLEPVARGLAAHLNWRAVRVESAADETRGVSASVWMVVTANEAFLATAGGAGGRVVVWTDDRASLLTVVR